MPSFEHLMNNKTVQNLFVWCLVFLLLIATVQPGNKVGTAIFTILLLAPAVYLSNLIILPFLKEKKVAFIGLFTANAVVFTCISALITDVVSDKVIDLSLLTNYFGIMILALILAATLKIARDSFAKRQEVQQKATETAINEEEAVTSIFVKSDKKIIKIDVDEIHYIEAYGNYIKIFTETMILTPQTLTDFLEKLPYDFIQIHKSFVINFNKLKLIDGNQMVLQSGAKLPIGKSYKKAVLDRI
ncbi:MAG: LytTR family DNA-binding domain-containing protein [Flavobacteriaceae bacterium]